MSDPAHDISELWASGAGLVYLITPEEDRAVALCRKAALALEAGAMVWSLHRGLDPLAPSAVDPIVMLEAVAKAKAPVVVAALDFHHALADRRVARALRDLLPRFAAEHRCLVVVASQLELPEGLASEAAVLRLPLPADERLGEVLDELAPGLVPTVRHRGVLAARGLTETQARRAFVRGLRLDRGLGEGAVKAIHEDKKRLLARDLGLETIEPSAHEQMGGMESLRRWVDERALAFSPEARGFGLPPPRGLLLLGVQGCGKSLSARYIAARLAVPLLRLDFPKVLGGSVSAEESLARALSAAEACAPVVLWVDEIEKAFAGSAHGADARTARLLGSFSTWLQERQGSVFMVATANDVSSLPPELLRRGRFDELFFVDLPDLEARRAILSLHLRQRERDPSLYEVNALAEACANFSGAELEQVVVGALHRAFAHKRELEVADLRRMGQELVPLYRTYEEQIKSLREWARGRARTAGREAAIVDLFRRVP
ncbi:MAG: AAA family ATPase [Myxococcaceae bacterium]